MEKYKNVFKPSMKLVISIVGVVFEGLCAGLNFIVLFELLDMIFDRSIDYMDILRTVKFLALIFAARMVLYTLSYTGSQTGGADVTRKIRIAIGDKLKRIPLGLFTKNRTGFYINAATGETADYEQILTHKMADIIKFAILILAMGIYSFVLCKPVGVIVMATLALLVPTFLFSIMQVNRYGVRKNLAREENVSAITEYLVGSQTLRSYNLAGTKNQSLTASMKNYSEISYLYEKAMLPIGFVYVLFCYVGIAASLIIMAGKVEHGSLKGAAFIVLFMILIYVSRVELTLYISLISYRNLLISKKKIAGIFEEKEEVEKEGIIPDTDYGIVFQNVDFSYVQGEKILDKASFTILPGCLTAIVGDSGSGKSTIFNLIAGYYEPDDGVITIGGKNTGEISTEEVLSHISMVDQDTFLFQDTVMNNIRYARENATDEEVKAACRLANCHDFIRKMPDGYNTLVGENGNTLSGGERQRLAIARAILRNSPIVLLDEVTSSLDIENELLVKEAIANLLKVKRTVIMIAHTLPIVENADNILVLDQGKVTEAGRHDELLKRNGKYTKMWSASQLITDER